MTIELVYGRGTLGVTPPPGCVPTVIGKQAIHVITDPSTAVEQALARPVGCALLSELYQSQAVGTILLTRSRRSIATLL